MGKELRVRALLPSPNRHTPRMRGIQYAAASPFHCGVSGYWIVRFRGRWQRRVRRVPPRSHGTKRPGCGNAVGLRQINTAAQYQRRCRRAVIPLKEYTFAWLQKVREWRRYSLKLCHPVSPLDCVQPGHSKKSGSAPDV